MVYEEVLPILQGWQEKGCLKRIEEQTRKRRVFTVDATMT
jgi:hypothetical protein